MLAFEGSYKDVDPTPRPPAEGKRIVVISSGQAASSSSVPADGAVAAAKALGWEADLYDAQLDASNFGPLVRQAVASGADGIVLVAIDCAGAKEPLSEAKEKGVAVLAIYAYDCDDEYAGGAGADPLFSTEVNFGEIAANDHRDFSRSYGADQANYIIAESDNTAKVIAIADPGFSTLHYTLEGFTDTINASGGSEIVSTLEVTVNDLTSGQIVPKIQAELLKHPDATWIKSPYTYVTTLGVAPALGANPNGIKVMGGEGFTEELDLMREGKITAANATSSEWVGWAAADSLNSYFRDEAPVEAGVGWIMVDKDHNLPESGPTVPSVDFKAQYRTAWGVD